MCEDHSPRPVPWLELFHEGADLRAPQSGLLADGIDSVSNDNPHLGGSGGKKDNYGLDN